MKVSSCKQPPSCLFKKYDHYDLSHINYDDQEVVQSAFQFLKQLDESKGAMEVERQIRTINLSQKTDSKPTKSLQTRMQTLSFSDQIDY